MATNRIRNRPPRLPHKPRRLRPHQQRLLPELPKRRHHLVPTTGAQTSLNGPIRTLWQQTGYETGRLGYPTSPQTCNQTADTCTQQFTGGKITWTPTRGAYITS
ncbi:LGFP repeat-containing protein [Arthrobacter sp. SA17]